MPTLQMNCIYSCAALVQALWYAGTKVRYAGNKVAAVRGGDAGGGVVECVDQGAVCWQQGGRAVQMVEWGQCGAVRAGSGVRRLKCGMPATRWRREEEAMAMVG